MERAGDGPHWGGPEVKTVTGRKEEVRRYKRVRMRKRKVRGEEVMTQMRKERKRN